MVVPNKKAICLNKLKDIVNEKKLDFRKEEKPDFVVGINSNGKILW